MPVLVHAGESRSRFRLVARDPCSRRIVFPSQRQVLKRDGLTGQPGLRADRRHVFNSKCRIVKVGGPGCQPDSALDEVLPHLSRPRLACLNGCVGQWKLARTSSRRSPIQGWSCRSRSASIERDMSPANWPVSHTVPGAIKLHKSLVTASGVIRHLTAASAWTMSSLRASWP
jgi:hypothetical protein